MADLSYLMADKFYSRHITQAYACNFPQTQEFHVPSSKDSADQGLHKSSQSDVVDLNRLYARPTERIQNAVLDHLMDFHKEYLAKATFFCLATGDGNGLDASPRGGPPGFVRVLDARTLAFADWPGNNRIASLRNLQNDDRLAMLFLFPGLETFLRINGRGRVSSDGDLMQELREGIKLPKTAIVIRIDEVLFHCGRAINRARLWCGESHLDPNHLPTVGEVMAGLAQLQGDAQLTSEQVVHANERYSRAVRTELY